MYPANSFIVADELLQNSVLYCKNVKKFKSVLSISIKMVYQVQLQIRLLDSMNYMTVYKYICLSTSCLMPSVRPMSDMSCRYWKNEHYMLGFLYYLLFVHSQFFRLFLSIFIIRAALSLLRLVKWWKSASYSDHFHMPTHNNAEIQS
jgi:hypothetical protein